MIRRAATWLAVLTTLSSAWAQSFSVPDADPTSGGCDAVPFGGSVHWSNQRVHFLVHAAELGNAPANISELAFASCGTATYEHARLRVSLAHVPAGLTLSPTFATNLGAAVGPLVTVLDQVDHLWYATQNTWSVIGLESRFAYDGVHDVLVEIEALGSGFTSTGPGTAGMRSAVGRPRVGFNLSGPWPVPPPIGTVINSAPKVQLRDSVASASVHGGGCNGMTLGFAGEPTIGGSFDVLLSGAPGFSVAVGLLGYTIEAPYPVGLELFGLPECSLRTNPFLGLPPVVTDASGESFVTLSVPSDPGVAGLRFFAQWFVATQSTVPLGTSNYGKFVLGP